jgi:hypothetical protein
LSFSSTLIYISAAFAKVRPSYEIFFWVLHQSKYVKKNFRYLQARAPHANEFVTPKKRGGKCLQGFFAAHRFLRSRKSISPTTTIAIIMPAPKPVSARFLSYF